MSYSAGTWLGAEGSTVASLDIFDELAVMDTVLLGETHTRADHHRWQLHVAAGLAARRNIIIGFEMFPARLDPLLADWVNGRLTETAFLAQVDWPRVWGHPAELYMPIFRFCREMSIPMLGLNVARELVRSVGADGWEGTSLEAREGLSRPKPSTTVYRKFIFDLSGGGRPGRKAISPDDPAFDSFVQAQEVWDRAFATRIATAIARPEKPLVIGIIGMGHVQFGGGVPWQLADLGIHKVRALIPSDNAASVPSGAVDAVFQLQSVSSEGDEE